MKRLIRAAYSWWADALLDPERYKRILHATPIMALRMDHRDSNLLDDVVVKNVTMFRAEMMSNGELWMACYFDNDERVSFWVSARKTGVLEFSVTEEPPEWINLDLLPKDHPAWTGK